MSYPAGSPVDQAIAIAYRDRRWTLRQCSYVFGPSVKTIAAILAHAGVPRRPPRDRQAGLPSPAELASILRYAQRGHPWWNEYGLPGGCDDLFTAVTLADRLIGQRYDSRPVWTRYSPAPGDADSLTLASLACGLIGRGITWIRLAPPERELELYIVGPSATGWWYARPRGSGLGLGWSAPTLAGLAARIKSRPATRIVSRR